MSCPICRGAPVADYRPFCSRRCADLDLGKWLNGDYAVPAAEVEDIENETQIPMTTDPKPH